MDLRTFLHDTETLLSDLESSMKASTVRSIELDLQHGEEGLGLDLFVASLIKNEVPVSPAQRDKLYELINYFDIDEKSQRYYPYLIRSSIDFLTVIEPDRGA